MAGNEIYVQVVLDDLLKALKSAVNAYGVGVRLTKRNNIPFLEFTIEIAVRFCCFKLKFTVSLTTR